MNKDQIKGRTREATGKVKEVTGKITGNKTWNKKAGWKKPPARFRLATVM